ncbi:hypothetical protein J3R82DRAFT_1604, partial [Butyriboletus roseoflavus]
TCNAILHGMTTIEAEHISYICIQVGHFTSSILSIYLSLHHSQIHFAILSMSQWCESDGVLRYFKLYCVIVSFIHNAINTKW